VAEAASTQQIAATREAVTSVSDHVIGPLARPARVARATIPPSRRPRSCIPPCRWRGLGAPRAHGLAVAGEVNPVRKPASAASQSFVFEVQEHLLSPRSRAGFLRLAWHGDESELRQPGQVFTRLLYRRHTYRYTSYPSAQILGYSQVDSRARSRRLCTSGQYAIPQ
jgi:hypothetical protein